MLFLRPDFELPCVGASTAGLRSAVRAFVADEITSGRITPRCNSWTESLASDFSRRLGERGWIGYHWPTQYGGRGGNAFDTLTINEELLAAGAPVGAHWIAARQSAPLLMRFGNEAQRQEFLPRIAAGSTYFAIGMSEPDVGSDLASVRSRAELADAEGRWQSARRLRAMDDVASLIAPVGSQRGRTTGPTPKRRTSLGLAGTINNSPKLSASAPVTRARRRGATVNGFCAADARRRAADL